MKIRDKNDLVTNSKECFTNHKEERYPCKTHPCPYTHRNKKTMRKVVYGNTGQTEVGSIWHVAPQEVNHDWLTMMVPGSVAGHWLA